MGRGATVGLSMLLVRNPMLSQPSHSNGMCGHLDGKDIDHHLSVINPTQNLIRRHPMAGDVGSPGLYNVRYNGNFWADSNCVEPPISSPFQNLTTKDVPMRIVTDFTTWLKSLQIGCHWTPHPFLIRTGF